MTTKPIKLNMRDNQERAEWLKEHGRTEGDVMGLSGSEYIIVDGEEEVEKLLLPKELQLQ